MLRVNNLVGFGSRRSSGIGGIDSFTKLALHCDGADASTTFTDSSASAHTVTANGNAQVDTAQSKFGGASLLLDGTGDYLSVGTSADWDFGTAAWTIDCWVRRNGSQADYAGIISAGQLVSGWRFQFGGPSVGATNSVNAVLNGAHLLTTAAIADATWVHVAFVRNSNTLTIYFDGTSAGSVSVAATTWDAPLGLTVGRAVVDVSDYYMNGHLDEVRVSKGIARWTANFTPPASPYST